MSDLKLLLMIWLLGTPIITILIGLAELRAFSYWYVWITIILFGIGLGFLARYLEVLKKEGTNERR